MSDKLPETRMKLSFEGRQMASEILDEVVQDPEGAAARDNRTS